MGCLEFGLDKGQVPQYVYWGSSQNSETEKSEMFEGENNASKVCKANN